MKTFKEIRETVSLDEAKTIKIVADTNTRKYKVGEVIKTFPETDKGLTQAMAFQKTIKDRLGVETKMIRESSDLNELSIDTMKSYRQKAADDVAKNKKPEQRTKGAVKATSKIYKKELGNLHKKEAVDPADVDDYEASDDDRKAADKNIVMQIRRAADLPKGSEIHFKDGKKFNMNQKTAKMIVKKFNAMRKPSDKEAFQNKASQSLAGLRSALGIK